MGFLDHINRVLHSKINFTSLKITNRNLLNPENKTLQRTNEHPKRQIQNTIWNAIRKIRIKNKK